ncbi:MAG: type II and III secretion system protein family protein [Nevskiaceae bacterium]|nr:MAG: type II and III secretion system protein family protein [Nevskiaceae bacterium]TBR72059.1 MAG: type II and III secretion system protein family protein [Nevskiaceae bacterium]
MSGGYGVNSMKATWHGLLRSMSFVLAAVALCGAGVNAAQAAATTPVPGIVSVTLGDHSLLRTPSTIGRIAVGDPKVADVALVSRAELLITGKGIGTTSLMVWSTVAARKANGEPQVYTVEVSTPGAAQATGGLAVHSGTTVSGTTADLTSHATAAALAGKGAADLSQVQVSSQVMTEIKIVDVQRNTMNQFGLNLIKQPVGKHSFFGTISPPGSISGVGSGSNGLLNSLSSASGFLPLQNAFNIIVGNTNSGGILGVLNVLEQNGLARVLAEPTLTAMSGQTASFLAGGEFPIPVAQSSSGGGSGGAAITIQYKQFGIRLTLTPTVLSNQQIALKVAPEVSDLDFSNAVSISGTMVPALVVRRTDTTVELGDGQTFILSGLVSNSLSNNVSKVPWLGDIPIIGAFFRTTTYQRQRRELIMVVTPHLVRPFTAGAKLPPLPGQSTDNYEPNFADTVLFGVTPDNATGYSH